MGDERPRLGGILDGDSGPSALVVLQGDFNFSNKAGDEASAAQGAAAAHEDSSGSSSSSSSGGGAEDEPAKQQKKRRRIIAVDSEVEIFSESEADSQVDLEVVDLCETGDECGDDGEVRGDGKPNVSEAITNGKKRAEPIGWLSIPAFKARDSPAATVNLAGTDDSGSDDSDVKEGKEKESGDSGFIPFLRSSDAALSRFDAALARNKSASGKESGDSGFIPFLRSSDAAPSRFDAALARNKSASGAPASRAGRSGSSLPFTGNSLRKSGALLQQKRAETAKKDRHAASMARLWPNTSRFYRAVLRWLYRPNQCTIQADAYSSERMSKLTPVPTEFESLLEFQRILSQLVLKEALGGLRDALAFKESWKSRLVEGEIYSACSLDVDAATASSSSDGKLYSLKVKLRLPPALTDAYGNEQEQLSPFCGCELVGLRSPTWKSSEVAPLGVVQPWDPVFDKYSVRPSGKEGVCVRVVVCANSVGGDGVGGRGGWIPLSDIQECLGKAKDSDGVPVSLISAGYLVTAAREFQAVMSISDFPEHVCRCLVDPSVSKEGRAPRPASSNLSARLGAHVGGRSGREEGSGGATSASDGGKNGGGECSPPPRVPAKLWETVVGSFNRSQVQAIRKVAVGSSAGFTLLQGPPGTGKTRTIMGVVGVLLAGGCPYPAGQGPELALLGGAESSGSGARITVGSAICMPKKGKGKQKGKQKAKQKAARVPSPRDDKNIRVLIVAPSNAAVDELVLRLCQDGVPGADGGVFFPNVVRVGAPRGDSERDEDAGGRGGRGGRDALQQATASLPVVQAVSLERLADNRKRNFKGSLQTNRLEVLLKAQVVCATLSGSGSQSLVESVMRSADASKAGVMSKGRIKRRRAMADGDSIGIGNSVLAFDAVVMDEAAQAVEPSSLIPLKYNPRAVVLVGDPAQLPATILSQEAKDANYGQSLFQRLQRGGHPKMMLDTQYRMHPSIASFASGRFYNGLLRSAPTVTEASHAQDFHAFPRFAPYLFHNVSAGRLRRGGGGGGFAATSLCNPVEVVYISSLLKDLMSAFPATDFNGRVGVIAPYRNQILALQRGLRCTGLREDGVEISTVDGFQGREKDIMIFSCVRAPEESASGDSGRNGGIGFMDDWRRLNVAITRAKYAMWIVGHAGVLKQSSDWRELIKDSKERGAFVDYLYSTSAAPVRGSSRDSSSCSTNISSSGAGGEGSGGIEEQQKIAASSDAGRRYERGTGSITTSSSSVSSSSIRSALEESLPTSRPHPSGSQVDRHGSASGQSRWSAGAPVAAADGRRESKDYAGLAAARSLPAPPVASSAASDYTTRRFRYSGRGHYAGSYSKRYNGGPDSESGVARVHQQPRFNDGHQAGGADYSKRLLGSLPMAPPPRYTPPRPPPPALYGQHQQQGMPGGQRMYGRGPPRPPLPPPRPPSWGPARAGGSR